MLSDNDPDQVNWLLKIYHFLVERSSIGTFVNGKPIKTKFLQNLPAPILLVPLFHLFYLVFHINITKFKAESFPQSSKLTSNSRIRTTILQIYQDDGLNNNNLSGVYLLTSLLDASVIAVTVTTVSVAKKGESIARYIASFDVLYIQQWITVDRRDTSVYFSRFWRRFCLHSERRYDVPVRVFLFSSKKKKKNCFHCVQCVHIRPQIWWLNYQTHHNLMCAIIPKSKDFVVWFFSRIDMNEL